MRQPGWLALAVIAVVLVVGLLADRATTVVTLGEQGVAGQRGDVRLVEGSNITITQDNAASTITVATTAAKSGSATITAGGTSVAVTHGLGTTPTRVFLTPTTDWGLAADPFLRRWWVSAKGATTFTITISTAHGSDISFDWRAQAEN